MVVAPPGLEEHLFQCLEQKLYNALTNPALQMTNEARDVARGQVARAEIQAVADQAKGLLPLIREAMRNIRK
jgi:hypothetical protein